MRTITEGGRVCNDDPERIAAALAYLRRDR